jgi:hypothetical protein
LKKQPLTLFVSALIFTGLTAGQAQAQSMALKLQPTGLFQLQDGDAEDEDEDEDLDALEGDDEEEEEAGEKADEGGASKEVSYGGAESEESIGGATGFVFPRGFYTSADLGMFMRFGGWTDGPECFRCQPRVNSNAQPYIGLSVGYDVLDFLGVMLSFGTGYVANAAPVEGVPDSPRDHGITFVNLNLIGTWYFLDRLALEGRVLGGGAFLVPAPDAEAPFYGGNAGGGIGLKYATLLSDVVVGVDANFYAVFSAGGVFIPAYSVAPVIKYVF